MDQIILSSPSHNCKYPLFSSHCHSFLLSQSIIPLFVLSKVLTMIKILSPSKNHSLSSKRLNYTLNCWQITTNLVNWTYCISPISNFQSSCTIYRKWLSNISLILTMLNNKLVMKLKTLIFQTNRTITMKLY